MYNRSHFTRISRSCWRICWFSHPRTSWWKEGERFKHRWYKLRDAAGAQAQQTENHELRYVVLIMLFVWFPASRAAFFFFLFLLPPKSTSSRDKDVQLDVSSQAENRLCLASSAELFWPWRVCVGGVVVVQFPLKPSTYIWIAKHPSSQHSVKSVWRFQVAPN